ncbi:MAG: hypothetical protein ACXW0U_05915 [Halobacteriota archaeon]
MDRLSHLLMDGRIVLEGFAVLALFCASRNWIRKARWRYVPPPGKMGQLSEVSAHSVTT